MTLAPFAQKLEKYAAALNHVEQASQLPTLDQTLALLQSRDAVQIALASEPQPPQPEVVQLIQLDRRLKQQASRLNQEDQLAQCRQSLHPAKEAWWWFLEAPATDDTDPNTPPAKGSRFNWVWNLMTVMCLVGAGTFATTTAQTLSTVGGFDLIGTFSTISQGAGLALVAGGTLTEKGQRVVEIIPLMNRSPKKQLGN